MQEALLRLHDAPRRRRTPRRFLTTVTTRLAIDVLRSARVRRETYVGTWLPEPLVEDEAPRGSRTRRRSRSRSSSCSSASTPGRARGARAARVVRLRVRRDRRDRRRSATPTAARSSAAPAAASPTSARASTPTRRERRALAARFLAAAREGDMEGLVAMLAPDAVLVGDGGGKARSIPQPMRRRRRRSPARSWPSTGWATRWGVTLEPALVNGQPGFRTLAPDGRLVNVVGARRSRAASIRRDPLDAQPRQARPPRPAVGRRLRPAWRTEAARRSGAANPTG